MVEIKLFRPLEGSKVKEFEAELKEYSEKTITVLTEEEEELVIDRSNLALIRLAFEF